MLKKSLLYISNADSVIPPLNYFERYIKESDSAYMTIIRLPVIRARNRIFASIKDEDEKTQIIDLHFPFLIPYFILYILQYVLHIVFLFLLLGKIKRKKFDIVIGENNFGGFVAFLLKKLKKANFSIFYNGDIVPMSSWSTGCLIFPNMKSRLNFLYKRFDTLLLKFLFFLRSLGYKNDLVWSINEKIKKYDEKHGLKNKRSIVANSILLDYKDYLKYSQIKKNMKRLCYIGRLDKYVGLDIVIPALKLIKQKIPDIKLDIIGGIDVQIQEFRQLATEYGVEEHIIFHGFLPKIEDAINIMASSALGIALYKPDENNGSMYTSPGKPIEYIRVGIPILVTTNGPKIGEEIIKSRAGVEADFNIENVASVICSVLNNPKDYDKLKQGVNNFARLHNYYDKFNHVWLEINKIC